ncbi:glycine-rich domain-containing protein, partial [Massilia horti]
MISKDEFQAIAELDLDPIKVKLMHKESGEGWTLEYANQIEFEYRRFLYLMKKFPNVPAAPLFDVDIFWHYHILDTMKYATDCDSVFGHFLHHFPYVGLRGEEDEELHKEGGARMQQLYEATFGEPYLRSAAVNEQAAASTKKTSFCWVEGTQATACAQKTAFCWVEGQQAPASAQKTAFCWVDGKQTAASAQKTAFCWVDGKRAAASAQKTAFCWVDGKQAAASAQKTAFCWVDGKQAAA